MPKTKITEITTLKSRSYSISNTVFIPYAIKISAVEGESSTYKLYGPSDTLPSTINNQSAIGAAVLALHSAGLNILLGEIIYTTGNNPFTDLKDKNLYDIRFLTLGAILTDSASASSYSDFVKYLKDIAEARGDCDALIDFRENDTTFSYKVTDVRALATQSSSYIAYFTPWFTTNDYNIYMPASTGYLLAYANNVNSNRSQTNAVAGRVNGVIPNINNLKHQYSTDDIEILQARSTTTNVDLDDNDDNNGVAINAIAYIRPFGNLIWGNRTATENKGTTNANSFLNIRTMVCAIKKVIYEAANSVRFEPNSDTTWLNFLNYINPTLDTFVTENGLAGYKWTKQTTDANARIKAQLKLVPVEGVEDFEIEVYLSANDVSTAE